MKYAVLISRIIVGTLFIVSGLVKVNDPIGFSYKLEEYFSPEVLNLGWLMHYSLTCSVIFSILEVVIGITMLAGCMIRTFSWVLSGMIVFFTFLTFYSAYFEKVTECGCFGDALKLTPWHSFWKDVGLLILTLIIFIKRKHIKLNSGREDIILLISGFVILTVFSLSFIDWGFPSVFYIVVFLLLLNSKKFCPNYLKEYLMVGFATLITSIFCWYCLAHLPLKDYRPFAIGKNIQEQMLMPADKQAPQYAVIYTLQHKQTKEQKEINSDEYVKSGIWKDENWEIIETGDPFLIKEGYTPPIQDFGIFNSIGDDISEDILNSDIVFIVVIKDVKESNTKVLNNINGFAIKAQEAGMKFIGVTASAYNEVEEYRHKYQLMWDFAMADETMLKTMVRSNPGILMLKKGTIAGKWHYNDFPNFDKLMKEGLDV